MVTNELERKIRILAFSDIHTLDKNIIDDFLSKIDRFVSKVDIILFAGDVTTFSEFSEDCYKEMLYFYESINDLGKLSIGILGNRDLDIIYDVGLEHFKRDIEHLKNLLILGEGVVVRLPDFGIYVGACFETERQYPEPPYVKHPERTIILSHAPPEIALYSPKRRKLSMIPDFHILSWFTDKFLLYLAGHVHYGHIWRKYINLGFVYRDTLHGAKEMWGFFWLITIHKDGMFDYNIIYIDRSSKIREFVCKKHKNCGKWVIHWKKCPICYAEEDCGEDKVREVLPSFLLS